VSYRQLNSGERFSPNAKSRLAFDSDESDEGDFVNMTSQKYPRQSQMAAYNHLGELNYKNLLFFFSRYTVLVFKNASLMIVIASTAAAYEEPEIIA
jgi:hypothetical protein